VNLKDSLQLAGQCLVARLDPERDFMPAGDYEVAYDIGRSFTLQWLTSRSNS